MIELHYVVPMIDSSYYYNYSSGVVRINCDVIFLVPDGSIIMTVTVVMMLSSRIKFSRSANLRRDKYYY